MEQLAARRAHNPKVAGSSPAPATNAMLKKLSLALLGAFLFFNLAHAELPDGVAQALKKLKIPSDSVAILVQSMDSNAPPLFSHNADKAMNPASVMKLVTTYAAVKKLSPHFTWKTNFWVDAMPDEAGLVRGNLYIQGGGDPFLTHSILENVFHHLARQGIFGILGDVVLDRSAFRLPPLNPNAFDGAGMRPYNTPPNALLLDFQTIVLEFSVVNGMLNVSPITPLRDLTLDFSKVKIIKGKCGNSWDNFLRFKTNGKTLTITGKMPACEAESLYIMPFDATTHAQMLLPAVMDETGIQLSGTVREGKTPENATLLWQHESEPLALALKSVNKFSNNVMARHLFLSLSLNGAPATLQNSRAVLENVLAENGLFFSELVVDNGAGLSRRARISANHLNALLLAIWRDPMMPEMLSTLPIVGIDGTLKKRYKDLALTGRAHFKTGSLNEAKALAGIIHGKNGQRYTAIILINHAKAYTAQPAIDAFLEWLSNSGF